MSRLTDTELSIIAPHVTPITGACRNASTKSNEVCPSMSLICCFACTFRVPLLLRWWLIGGVYSFAFSDLSSHSSVALAGFGAAAGAGTGAGAGALEDEAIGGLEFLVLLGRAILRF